ncbi:MAG: sigma-70 family RNA polymerase sigma factor, partial [Prevotella sp.]|nr:sigma-70 family RNA polymerase sigma factor [Prevotella sp.]
RKKVRYVEIDDRTPVADSDVDEAMADNSRTEQLRRAIDLLKPNEKTLITLYYYDDLPTKDIAYITGMEAGTVTTQLHRIRKKLYLIMNKDNGE